MCLLLLKRSKTRSCWGSSKLPILGEFKVANQSAVRALTSYQSFLKDELLPVSKGDFRIGVENFRKKLLYEEMVVIPIDCLLVICYSDLLSNQERMMDVAG